MNFLRVTTIVSLMLSTNVAYAATPITQINPKETSQKGGSPTTSTSNPFDIPVSTSSQPSVKPSTDGKKSFYRAGKEATQLPQETPSEPELFPDESQTEPDFMEIDSEVPAEELPIEPATEPIDSEVIPGEESLSTSGEEPATEPDHGSAPSALSIFGSLGSIIQYTGIAVACGGGLFLFFFFLKKKKLTSATAPVATVNTSSVENTPVDSNRVKKALAAFHEDAPQEKAQPVAEEPVSLPTERASSVDDNKVKEALASFHETPAS